jgi:hypothetical protein
MFRSIMFVCALGAIGAVGCVGTSDAADESATAQNTGSGGLFDCQNNHSVSVVCTGDISILNGLTVNVDKTLDGNQLSVLSGDLNNVKITDINILDGNKILDDVYAVVLNDFLNKFNINVTKNDIDVCALVGILQLCKQ